MIVNNSGSIYTEGERSHGIFAQSIGGGGGNAGIGFGLSGKLNPPLDKDEVANWGVVAHAIGALQYFLTDSIYIGAEFLPGYHYFIPGGDATVDEATQGLHYMAFLSTGFHFEPFESDSDDRSKRRYRPYRPQPGPSAAPPPARVAAE